MANELIFEIIKWTLIVFVAGFIGYFGKHLGKMITGSFSKKKPEQTAVHSESFDKNQTKIEKKKLKLEKKKLKLKKK